MYKLSPSDFAYLYEECKLCYYLKVKHGIYQPSMPMPGVFSAINTRIQGSLIGKELTFLAKGLPDGKVVTQEGWVESKSIPDTKVFIKGKYDLLLENNDRSYTLVDLKISSPNVGKIDKYKTQLGAYKFALENPSRGKAINISRLGLLIFYPEDVEFTDGVALLHFPPKWLEVPIDDQGFLDFTKEISNLLDGDFPEEGMECKWCRYRHTGEKLAHLKKQVQDDLPF